MNWRCLLLLPLLSLSGCLATLQDEMAPPDTGWEPSGVNAANIAAMAANPADLQHGRSSPGAVGAEAGPAVLRLWSGKAKPLVSGDSGLAADETTGGAAPAATPPGG